MNKVERSKQSTKNAANVTPLFALTSAGADAEDVHRMATNVRTAVEAARERLGYLARNMDAAFDGQLGGEESNAYAALVYVLGVLTDIDEEAGALQGHAKLMARERAS